MSTYPSPVSVAELQTYLRDTSTDTGLLAFYQSLLDTATEQVYNWVDRDYTPSASKTDVFWGDDSIYRIPRYPVGTLVTWFSFDHDGNQTNVGTDDLLIRSEGLLLESRTVTFAAGLEHRITYQQPSTLVCPETVRQVIIELAAMMFIESKQGASALGLLSISKQDGSRSDHESYLDMTPRQQSRLFPYRRIAV